MSDRQHDASQLQGRGVQCFQNNNNNNNNNNNPGRPTKKFFSFDSLRFEKERLETFIDWPVVWMKPEDLAKDGFYYLRTKDHCACIFCGIIVGAWEQGDIPREEHKRHFPQCPFIQGRHPVGNIPLAHSIIILGITPSPDAVPVLSQSMYGRDVCGSSPECRPPKKSDSIYSRLGLPPHTGPEWKGFLSLESREKSFMGWPDGVKQTPKELAEAGFFYCGRSDHVRCFYCGNGLRNWEKEDDPWEEHASWYPECNFVLVKKGQEFIDGVKREKPPYLPRTAITERELDLLMKLDIIKTTLEMGFPVDKVRPALRRKLEQTGLPFFTLEACIEAILQYMESCLALTKSARSLEFASQQGAQAVPSAHKSQTSSSSFTPSTTTSTVNEVSSPLFSSPQHSPTSSSEPTAIESSPITRAQEDLAALELDVGLDLKDTRICKVCMDAELDMVFLPCTHMVTCSSCALTLNQCPICREDIKYAIKPIIA